MNLIQEGYMETFLAGSRQDWHLCIFKTSSWVMLVLSSSKKGGIGD